MQAECFTATVRRVIGTAGAAVLYGAEERRLRFPFVDDLRFISSMDGGYEEPYAYQAYEFLCDSMLDRKVSIQILERRDEDVFVSIRCADGVDPVIRGLEMGLLSLNPNLISEPGSLLLEYLEEQKKSQRDAEAGCRGRFEATESMAGRRELGFELGDSDVQQIMSRQDDGIECRVVNSIDSTTLLCYMTWPRPLLIPVSLAGLMSPVNERTEKALVSFVNAIQKQAQVMITNRIAMRKVIFTPAFFTSCLGGFIKAKKLDITRVLISGGFAVLSEDAASYFEPQSLESLNYVQNEAKQKKVGIWVVMGSLIQGKTEGRYSSPGQQAARATASVSDAQQAPFTAQIDMHHLVPPDFQVSPQSPNAIPQKMPEVGFLHSFLGSQGAQPASSLAMGAQTSTQSLENQISPTQTSIATSMNNSSLAGALTLFTLHGTVVSVPSSDSIIVNTGTELIYVKIFGLSVPRYVPHSNESGEPGGMKYWMLLSSLAQYKKVYVDVVSMTNSDSKDSATRLYVGNVRVDGKNIAQVMTGESGVGSITVLPEAASIEDRAQMRASLPLSRPETKCVRQLPRMDDSLLSVLRNHNQFPAKIVDFLTPREIVLSSSYLKQQFTVLLQDTELLDNQGADQLLPQIKQQFCHKDVSVVVEEQSESGLLAHVTLLQDDLAIVLLRMGLLAAAFKAPQNYCQAENAARGGRLAGWGYLKADDNRIAQQRQPVPQSAHPYIATVAPSIAQVVDYVPESLQVDRDRITVMLLAENSAASAALTDDAYITNRHTIIRPHMMYAVNVGESVLRGYSVRVGSALVDIILVDVGKTVSVPRSALHQLTQQAQARPFGAIFVELFGCCAKTKTMAQMCKSYMDSLKSSRFILVTFGHGPGTYLGPCGMAPPRGFLFMTSQQGDGQDQFELSLETTVNAAMSIQGLCDYSDCLSDTERTDPDMSCFANYLIHCVEEARGSKTGAWGKDNS